VKPEPTNPMTRTTEAAIAAFDFVPVSIAEDAAP
jgi:hypothetical protein